MKQSHSPIQLSMFGQAVKPLQTVEAFSAAENPTATEKECVPTELHSTPVRAPKEPAQFQAKILTLQHPPHIPVSRGPRADSPFLKKMWLEIRRKWFPNRPDLDSYQVRWSTRSQLQTLASCSLDFKRISVARELAYKRHAQWLEPLLYHEMCHAYLDTTDHGREFKAVEHRHPMIKPFDKWIDAGGWDDAIDRDRTRRSKKELFSED
jgi:hypothetical protein